MIKKSLWAVALAALAVGGTSPASADAQFLEEYGDIFGGRTLLGTRDEGRPENALQGKESEAENPTSRLVISPFYRTQEVGDLLDFTYTGVGFAYANAGGNPWQLGLNLYNTDIDIDGGGDNDFFGWDVTGKLGIWNQRGGRGPAVSLVGRYQDLNKLFSRWDAVLAADIPVSNRLYGTINLGYASAEGDGGGDAEDFIPGLGLTWAGGRRWSLSADYRFKNDVDFDEDMWTIGALYNLSEAATIRVGGGKNGTWFANFILNQDN